MRRTITSENKLNDFSADQVNEVLRESVANKYQKSGRVILIHDYILEGIKSILTKYRVDRVFVRHQPDKSTLSAIHDMAGYHGD